MKRVFAVALLVMLSATISFGQTKDSKPPKKSAAAASANPVADAIIAKEKQVTDALIKKDQKAFESLVAPDAILSGADGRMSIKDFKQMAFGPAMSITSSTIDDPQVMMIDKDAAIITYKSTGSGTMNDKPMSGTSYATSIWVKRGNNWVAIFHQESDVPPTGSSMNP